MGLANGHGFTDEQRQRFAGEIALRMTEARAAEEEFRGADARPIAVAQALFKRRDRDVIRCFHPDVRFVWIRADQETRVRRLRAGANLVDDTLGDRMTRDFEPPGDGEWVENIENGFG